MSGLHRPQGDDNSDFDPTDDRVHYTPVDAEEFINR